MNPVSTPPTEAVAPRQAPRQAPRRPCDDDPIFIVGWGRTGTSLLRSMMNAHPRIYLTQEANLYDWTVSRRLTSTRARLEAYFHSFSFAWLGIEHELVLDRFPGELKPEDFSPIYEFVLRTAAERHGCARFGDKNPTNQGHLERIFNDFENPRVIRMMRDPRAVAVSHTRMPFSTPSLMLINHIMRGTPEYMRPFEDKMHTVRLEDLIAKPRDTMERILDYIGEPWDDAVMDHVNHIPPHDGIPFPWLEPSGARPEPRPPSWPKALSPAWVRLIEKANRETMERFGYPIAELGREPTSFEMSMAQLKELPLAVSFVTRAACTLLRLAVPPWVPAERNQRMLHTLNPRAWKRNPDWSLPVPPSVRP